MFYNNFFPNPYASFAKPETAFDAWNTKVELVTGPARQLTALTLEKLEKLTEAQIDSYRTYSTLGIENAQAALSIHDFSSYQSYMESQKDVMKQVSDQVSIDARTYAEFGSAFANGMRETSEATVEEVTKPAKKKSRTKAR